VKFDQDSEIHDQITKEPRFRSGALLERREEGNGINGKELERNFWELPFYLDRVGKTRRDW